ncbi:hypothetical protein SBA1_180041 [Candidatus Sulfotelmatobacter kueseliae]|uniref:Uncharacterized protein n=1 Tax=Candidatus Sulfotelmatobacter kueseliae TaxID=2042962 RepID=A0A2U3KCM0_9BACT|nr:hypothetical protein SBA1_180041 [Candidatus Sulfotelmatobacter kueseliae]
MNLLNYTVFGDLDNIVLGGGFGGIFSAADPHIGQLAMKLSSCDDASSCICRPDRFRREIRPLGRSTVSQSSM